MTWGVFNKIYNFAKKKVEQVAQIPQKLINTGKNIGKWFVKLTKDPIGALKELPKEYLKLYWNIIKDVINDFDDMTTIKVELLNEFGDLGGPKFKIAGIILKKLNDLRVPVTDKLKEVIYKFVDEQFDGKKPQQISRTPAPAPTPHKKGPYMSETIRNQYPQPDGSIHVIYPDGYTEIIPPPK